MVRDEQAGGEVSRVWLPNTLASSTPDTERVSWISPVLVFVKKESGRESPGARTAGCADLA
jgi:hypothetical protein